MDTRSWIWVLALRRVNATDCSKGQTRLSSKGLLEETGTSVLSCNHLFFLGRDIWGERQTNDDTTTTMMAGEAAEAQQPGEAQQQQQHQQRQRVYNRARPLNVAGSAPGRERAPAGRERAPAAASTASTSQQQQKQQEVGAGPPSRRVPAAESAAQVSRYVGPPVFSSSARSAECPEYACSASRPLLYLGCSCIRQGSFHASRCSLPWCTSRETSGLQETHHSAIAKAHRLEE